MACHIEILVLILESIYKASRRERGGCICNVLIVFLIVSNHNANYNFLHDVPQVTREQTNLKI